MFCSSLRKSFALAGALVSVACAAPSASAGVERARAPGSAVAGAPAVSQRSPVVPVAPAAPEATDADRALGIEWRFHAGSSVHAPPVVAPDGTVYVGTGDGYVEAVNPDGSLKWSYTVEGAVAWSPLVDSSSADHVIVATTAQRLYSISAAGLPAWEVRPPAHPSTDLSPAPGGAFLFGATDGSVWAYSVHSAALWHTEIGGTITAVPAVRGSRTVVGTSTGEVWLLDGAAKRCRAQLGARIRGAPAILADGSVVVVAGTTLIRLDPRANVLSRREGVESFGVAGTGLVAIETSGALVVLADDGTVTEQVSLPSRPSSAPVAVGPGMVAVGTETGEVLFVGSGALVRRVGIARAALHRPVLDAARGRVIVAAGSGIVAAVALSSAAGNGKAVE